MLIAQQKQRVVEKEAETDRKRAEIGETVHIRSHLVSNLVVFAMLILSFVNKLEQVVNVIYEQRVRVFHRHIQTRENNGELPIVFECLDIPVGHELELFIWLLK